MSLGRTLDIRRIAAPVSIAGLAILAIIGAWSLRSSDDTDSTEAGTGTIGETAGEVAGPSQDGTGTLLTLDDDARLEDRLACPALTDPIVRMYNALFNAPPEQSEFFDLASQYQTGQIGLEGIAEQLLDSDRFETAHGALTDERFVSLMYRSVVRESDPSDSDSEFWVSSLSAGMSRASMLLTFTETASFARRTETETPLSGYLRWYPEGTHWYCGVGPRDAMSIRPLSEEVVYADYAFFNGGSEVSGIGLTTVLEQNPHLAVSSGTLPPGFTSYKWGGLFNGDGNYGTALDLNVGSNTSWIVVFYPTSIGDQRLGWQIEL